MGSPFRFALWTESRIQFGMTFDMKISRSTHNTHNTHCIRNTHRTGGAGGIRNTHNTHRTGTHRDRGARLWRAGALTLASLALTGTAGAQAAAAKRPNVLLVMADQWRAQATGYAGDTNARTPNLDSFAARSLNFTHAVSVTPVCSPYRAALLTGQFAMSNGMLANDLDFKPAVPTLGEVFKAAGYATGYVGKWHLFGGGRRNFIPADKRFGFDHWKVMNCTHDYNNSDYWPEEPAMQRWQGYDAFAQTDSALAFMEGAVKQGKPFLCVLAWGPPHSPYHTAPAEHRALFNDPAKLTLRDNVPDGDRQKAREALAGYYAHCSALDKSLGDIIARLEKLGALDNTIVIFTSDHGDMLYSHGHTAKSRPYDESIRVPFLMHCPRSMSAPRVIDEPLTTPDIMPTLLDMCGIAAPGTCEGRSFYKVITGAETTLGGAALFAWPVTRPAYQLNEYHGIRTARHTYVEEIAGAWLLFDNQEDPFQLVNLANKPEHAALQAALKARLDAARKAAGDEFLPEKNYLERFNIAPEKLREPGEKSARKKTSAKKSPEKKKR